MKDSLISYNKNKEDLQKIIITSATKLNKEDFRSKTSLGKSLTKQLGIGNFNESDVEYNNKRGLGEIYNERIEKYNDEILICVHDDVSIEDIFLREKLYKSMKIFDIVGLAGASYFSLNSPVLWHRCPKKYWSGSVSHPQDKDLSYVTSFGPTPKNCIVIDGLFIALNLRKIKEKGIKFQEEFKFHFYDLAFCIESYKKKLKIGTWPIWVVHQSHGEYYSEEWNKMEKLFIEKYKEK